MNETPLRVLLRETREAVEQLDQARSQASEVDEVNRVDNELVALERSVRITLSALDAVRGLRDAPENGQLDEARRAWQGLRTSVEAARTFDERQARRRKLDTECRKLNDQTKEILAAVGACWQRFVDGLVDSEGIETLVAAMEDTRPSSTLNEMRSLLGEAERLRRDPPTKAALTRLQDLAEELRGHLADLVGDDPEVREFIQAAGGEGANLSQYTPAVSSWLEQRGLVDQFRVVARGAEL